MDPESEYKKIYTFSDRGKFQSLKTTPLVEAATEGNLNKIKLYLPTVLKYVNAKKLLDCDIPGITRTYETDIAFEKAAENEHIHIMKYLMRLKCIQDHGSAFYNAMLHNKPNIIDFILKYTDYDPSQNKNSNLKFIIKQKNYNIANQLYLDERVRKQPIPKYVLKHIKPEYLEQFKPIVDNTPEAQI